MRREITEAELNKKVKEYKAKLVRGKSIALAMLIICAVALLICAVLVAMGITGEESVFTYSLYLILGILAVVCLYPGLYALIRLPYILKLFKKVKELERTDMLREMVFDFETSKTVNFGDKAVLSDKYLFPKNFKRVPIPCDEIYWIYTKTFKRYLSINLGTKKDRIVSYSGVEEENRRCSEILRNAFLELQKRTDRELLFDYTAENEAKYKALVGEK